MYICICHVKMSRERHFAASKIPTFPCQNFRSEGTFGDFDFRTIFLTAGSRVLTFAALNDKIVFLAPENPAGFSEPGKDVQ